MNIHPGEILLEEFLKPLGISSHRLARETGLDPARVSLIVRGRRSITPETALKFAKFFEGTTPAFWLNLQKEYDLREAAGIYTEDLKGIRSYKEIAVL